MDFGKSIIRNKLCCYSYHEMKKTINVSVKNVKVEIDCKLHDEHTLQLTYYCITEYITTIIHILLKLCLHLH